MPRLAIKVSLPLLLLIASVHQADAQGPGRRPQGYAPSRRPTVSPYLNLLRRDNFGPLNYQTLVRPELEFRARLEQQGRAIGGVRRDVDENTRTLERESGLRTTGHQSYFLNYGNYYPGLSRGRGR